jgi:hypothetical protein
MIAKTIPPINNNNESIIKIINRILVLVTENNAGKTAVINTIIIKIATTPSIVFSTLITITSIH